jgi:hypothetical protein
MSATGLAWHLDLKGPDGNAYVILGTVSRLIQQTWPGDEGREVAASFRKRATSGDYENLLRVATEYVELRQLGPMIVLADAPQVEADELDQIAGR